MSNSSAIPIPGTCYIVGGAVRDSLLGIDSKDRDWVVVGATPEQMIDAGFKQVGADFPVFLHPTTNEEYALARTERKQGHGYHGFVCDFGPDISLKEDLERRDLRINAMAMSSNGELIDPFGGKEDLSKKVLRHVSDAFSEDPLRVLRVARFAARFHDLGFRVDADTMGLMSDLVNSHELSKLTAERVWQETSRALSEKAPWVYFELLRESGALAVIMPELDVLFGVPQPEKHHPEIDCGVHALLSLRSATALSESVSVRFAALIHDLGKGLTPEAEWPKHHGHEKSGLKPIKQLCKRLKTPRRDQTLALLACEFHTHIHRAYELRPETVLKVLKACDALRKPDLFQDVLLVCQADALGRTGFENQAYPQADYFAQALRLVRSFNIKPLLDSGLEGKELGAEIDRQRTLILAEHRTLHQKRPS